MRLTYRLLVCSLFTFIFLTYEARAATPSSCTSPPIIAAGGGTVSGNTNGQGNGFQGTCANSGGPELIYQWTPSSNGTATIDVCGAGTSYDTVLYVRTTCLTSGTQVACNDDACQNSVGSNVASRVTFNATSGTTYYIFVDGFGSASGTFALHVSLAGGGTTTTVVTTTTTTIVTTTTTTTSGPTTTTTTLCIPGDVTPPTSTPGPLSAVANDCTSINVSWGIPSDASGLVRYFVWTYDQSSRQFNVTGIVTGHPPATNFTYTNFPKTVRTTQYFVITAEDNCGNQSEFDMQTLFGVAMNGCPATTTTTLTTTTTTTTSTAVITTTTITTSTTTTTLVSTGTCSSPVTFPTGGGSLTGFTTGSGNSPSPGTCGGSGGPEQVFSWTPNVTGTATVNTCGGTTNFDTVLYARATTCITGTELACNDDSCLNANGAPVSSQITFPVTSGQTYFLFVDAHGTSSGNFTLNASVAAATTTTTVSSVTTTTMPVGAMHLSLAGMVPGVGNASDVVIDGVTNRAYVASSQFGLSIVNIFNPASSTTVGVSNIPFYANRVAVAGTIAVTGGGTVPGAGFRVLDVSSPSAPRSVGFLNENITAIARAGNFAYALILVSGNPGHTDIGIIDLTTPSNPILKSRLTLPSSSSGLPPDIALSGSNAFVTAGDNTLQVYNISNPMSITPIGSLTTLPTSGGRITISGGTAYIAGGNTFEVINIGTPSAPTLVGSLATSITQVVPSGTKAYAVDGSTLKVIDISNPTLPVLSNSSTSHGASSIGIKGTVTYLASLSVETNNTQGGLWVIDLTTPSSPSILADVYGAFENKSIATSGSLVAIAGGTLGMKIVNITTPSAPTTVGALTLHNITSVTMASNYVYAIELVSGNPGHSDLIVVDISTPSSPLIVGRVTLPSSSSGLAPGVAVSGSNVFVTAGNGTLMVYNVSTPSAPIVAGSGAIPASGGKVIISGNRAYIAGGSVLEVVDITTPTSPNLLGSTTTTVTDVAVSSTKAYTVDGSTLRVFDVSGSTPMILSNRVVASVQGVSVIGNTVALTSPGLSHADLSGGVYDFNLSTPTNPQQVQLLMVPGTSRTITAAGSTFYAGDNASVVDVIQVVP